MAKDYFAHTVVGVLLTGEARTLFDDLYARCEQQAAQKWIEDADEPLGDGEDLIESWREVFDRSEQIDQVLTLVYDTDDVRRIARMAGAPVNALFFYTGDEDDRPGRCNTDADEWVVGFSLYDYEKLVRRQFSARHRKNVDAHSWVTSG